jgi:hypothetical protein
MITGSKSLGSLNRWKCMLSVRLLASQEGLGVRSELAAVRGQRSGSFKYSINMATREEGLWLMLHAASNTPEAMS